MKKILFCFFLLATLGSTFATNEDTQLFDVLADEQITADDLQFSSFASCDEMNSVLTDYIKDNFKNQWNGVYRGGPMPVPMPMIMDDMMAFEESADMAITTTSNAVPIANLFGGSSGRGGENTAGSVASTSKSSTNDFSTTNTQVIGIDEADILKSDGDYLYYYNQKEHKVNIIKTPLDIASKTIDMGKLNVITNINLPKNFNGIQMYRQADNLVIIANRWRNTREQGFLNNGNQVDVIVYDVSNPEAPALLRFTELDGNYHDSRLIGDKLYVINQLHLNRYRPMNHWANIDDIDLKDIELTPKNIDIAYTRNNDKKNLNIGDDTFPYHISVNKADCNKIYYVLPNKDSIEQFGLHPSFTTVNVVDLSITEKTPDLTTAFGTTNTIHMAKDNLYLTQHFYVPGESWNCPPNARCIRPRFNGGRHTLIHKFNVDADRVRYQTSALANGSPLTQYSMDQGPEGNFRILTSTRQPERATHLYVLDDNLSTIGSVENIEPGEEFKSSRYIGDKLYLVTFEATDPLFVIDMVKPTDPKIIGELVIPGFSTYLHPYGPVQNNVQYLLGLGWDTDLNERGGTVQEGIKLDLYKIDYNKKDTEGHVSVTQEYSKIRGNRGSQSEAIHNPRMFVWDAKKKLLVLPMQLMEYKDGNEVCESERDPNGNIIREECRNNGTQETTFIGMKAMYITPEQGIVETSSFDYTHLFKQDKQIYNNGWFNTRQLMPRVGYVGDVLYQVNGAFGHFVDMSSGASQSFLPLGTTSINFDPQVPTGSAGNGYNNDMKGTAICLADMGWSLYTSNLENCKFCDAQMELFENNDAGINYLAFEVETTYCNEDQLRCSDANITGYPSWVSPTGEVVPGLQQIDELYTMANCGE